MLVYDGLTKFYRIYIESIKKKNIVHSLFFSLSLTSAKVYPFVNE
jgi:hypothetical protein